MKMTIVSAFGKGFEQKPELEGKSGNSYAKIFALLSEGDHVTVEFPGKGFKEFSMKDGQFFVQRNFAYDY